MERNILLAVDDSKNAAKAVDYISKRINPKASVTILSILPDATSACGLDSPSLIPLFNQNRSAFCSLEDKKREKMKVFSEKAKKRLVQSGFTGIKVSLRKKKSGIARDIIKELKTGKYDTVVLGRHGMSGIKDFFYGTVTSKVAQQAAGLTVIIAD